MNELTAGAQAAAAVDILASYITNDATCGVTILFAKSGNAVVGLYAGADVQKQRLGDMIQELSMLLEPVLTMVPLLISGTFL